MVTMDMILEWQKIEIEKIMMVLDNIFYVYKNNFWLNVNSWGEKF